MNKKPEIVRILQFVHLAIFTLAIFVIFLLHLYTQNFLDFLRIPIFLKSINPLLGFGWPASLHVYQTILVFSLFLIFVDAAGLFFYRSRIWRIISDVSSFLGLLVIWPVALFFIFTLASAEKLEAQNIQTITVYFLLSLFLVILDLVTWFVDEQSLIKLRKK